MCFFEELHYKVFTAPWSQICQFWPYSAIPQRNTFIWHFILDSYDSCHV